MEIRRWRCTDPDPDPEWRSDRDPKMLRGRDEIFNFFCAFKKINLINFKVLLLNQNKQFMSMVGGRARPPVSSSSSSSSTSLSASRRNRIANAGIKRSVPSPPVPTSKSRSMNYKDDFELNEQIAVEAAAVAAAEDAIQTAEAIEEEARLVTAELARLEQKQYRRNNSNNSNYGTNNNDTDNTLDSSLIEKELQADVEAIDMMLHSRQVVNSRLRDSYEEEPSGRNSTHKPFSILNSYYGSIRDESNDNLLNSNRRQIDPNASTSDTQLPNSNSSLSQNLPIHLQALKKSIGKDPPPLPVENDSASGSRFTMAANSQLKTLSNLEDSTSISPRILSKKDLNSQVDFAIVRCLNDYQVSILKNEILNERNRNKEISTHLQTSLQLLNQISEAFKNSQLENVNLSNLLLKSQQNNNELRGEIERLSLQFQSQMSCEELTEEALSSAQGLQHRWIELKDENIKLKRIIYSLLKDDMPSRLSSEDIMSITSDIIINREF